MKTTRNALGFALALVAGTSAACGPEALDEAASGDDGDVALDESEITGASRVSASSVPSVVRLRILRNDGLVAGCTGSLVSARSVLTAAHCLTGVSRLDVVFASGAVRTVPRYKIHPNYLPNWQPIALYGDRGSADLALVELGTAAPTSARATLAATNTAIGRTLRLVGYGATSAGGYVQTTPSAGNATVVRSWGQWFSASGPAAACDGDSGGPAFDANGRVVGVMVKATWDCSGSILLQSAAYAGWVTANLKY